MEEATAEAYGDAPRLRRIALLIAAAVIAVLGLPLLASAALGRVDQDARQLAVLMVLNGSALFVFGVLLLAFPRGALHFITDVYRQWPEQFWVLSPFKSTEEPRRSRTVGSIAYVAFAGGFAGGGIVAALCSVVTLLR